MDFQAVVLAAGKGSRMGAGVPKVLIPLCGRPMVLWVLDLLADAGIPRPVVVVSGDAVREAVGERATFAVQPEQRGSGHAVLCAKEIARGSRYLVVACGDSPLFRPETLRSLMSAIPGAAVGLVSAELPDPSGYGRILRSPAGEVAGVVEEKLATDTERRIREINGGLYAFDAEWLWENLHLMRENEAGEYCLTEMVDIAVRQGRRVIAVPAQPDEVLGVNTPAELAAAEGVLDHRP
ncbi:MAG: NTP transferase domain-containing protein [Armatimonadota bacterium]